MGTLIGIVLVIGAISLYKYNVPGTILWGGIGVIVYIGFVYNEMSKGINFNTAWKYPSAYIPDFLVLLIGVLGLISLLISIYTELKKKSSFPLSYFFLLIVSYES